LKIVNPYEYIYSKVPGSIFSVSKLKTKSNMFYELLEIIKTIHFLDNYNLDTLNTLIIGNNYQDSLECFEMLREMYTNDKFDCFEKLNSNYYNMLENKKFNLIIYEINELDTKNINLYTIKFLEVLMIILNNLTNFGSAIIKIENIFYKPIIDILFFLSSIFDKLYIIKPLVNNITSFEKYIVVKKMSLSKNKILYKNYSLTIKQLIINYENKKINKSYIFNNIISNEIPYYFLSKIEDLNVILGQPQLETFNQIIHILKNKNMDEKIETLKKNNIQKSVGWCEKYKIPCNKFSDKINIFLPVVKEVYLF
jgi:hypothetical protein